MSRYAAVISVVFLSSCSTVPPGHPFLSELPAGPQIVAERCGDQENPGNTLRGCEAARASGATVLGIDIWLSSDGVPVLANSADLSAFSESNGDLEDQTFAELQMLDAAYNWSPQGILDTDGDEVRHPYRGMGYTIPRLSAVGALGGPLLINSARPSAPLAEALRAELDDDELRRVCFWTETRDGAQILKEAMPTACVAFPDTDLSCLDWTRIVPLDWGPCRTWDLIVAGATTSGGRLQLTEAFVEAAEGRGWPILARTEGDPYLVELLFLLGVEGVLTPGPSDAVEIRERIAHEL